MRNWFYPLNIKYLDFVKCLHDSDTLDVRQFSNYKFEIGDKIYIYSGQPHSQFLYIMQVIKNNIPYEEAELHNEYSNLPQKSTVNDWMRLKVVMSVPIGTKSLQSAMFAGKGFSFLHYPKLIKDNDLLNYLDEEFEKYNCE